MPGFRSKILSLVAASLVLRGVPAGSGAQASKRNTRISEVIVRSTEADLSDGNSGGWVVRTSRGGADPLLYKVLVELCQADQSRITDLRTFEVKEMPPYRDYRMDQGGAKDQALPPIDLARDYVRPGDRLSVGVVVFGPGSGVLGQGSARAFQKMKALTLKVLEGAN